LLEAMGTPALPEQDPARAKTIMKVLEAVPEDLVRRYEKLRAGLEGEGNEGCAICRECYLDPPGEDIIVATALADLPYAEGEADGQRSNTSKILVFPCPGMHLFHSNCLSPWLSRKTTCPTCRFDIDPDSLTLTFLRELRVRTDDPMVNRRWTLPKGRGFRKWLEREERKLNINDDLEGEAQMQSYCSTLNLLH
jgi:hypothetical protein